MSVFLDKVLTALILPPGLMIVGLVIALAFNAFGFRKSGIALGWISTIALWALATPLVSDTLVETLEDQYPAQMVEAYPVTDVVIVLGGAISPPNALNPYPDLNEGADRLMHGLRIYRSGKAKKILLSGGRVFDPESDNNEARAMAELLATWGVPRGAIQIEGASRNTYENARNSAAVWQAQGFHTGLLVTSASHMPRALAAFRKLGLTVSPAATDYNGPDGETPFPLSVLPTAGSLEMSARMIKEWIGLLVYRWRGWA